MSMEKHMFNSVQFPILYETPEIVVYRNPSGEVFIKTKTREKKDVTIRIGKHVLGIGITTDDGVMTPSSSNGLQQIVVRHPSSF